MPKFVRKRDCFAISILVVESVPNLVEYMLMQDNGLVPWVRCIREKALFLPYSLDGGCICHHTV